MALRKYLPWSVSVLSLVAWTMLDMTSVSLSALKVRAETDVLFLKSVMSWKLSEVKSGDPDGALAA